MSPDLLLTSENIISTSFPITAMSAFLSSALTLFPRISDTIDGSSGKFLTSIALSLCFCALRRSISPALIRASDLRSSYTGPGSVVPLNLPCLPRSAMDLASRQSFFSGDGSSVGLQHEDDIVKIVLLRYPVHFGKKPQEPFPTVLELLRR